MVIELGLQTTYQVRFVLLNIKLVNLLIKMVKYLKQHNSNLDCFRLQLYVTACKVNTAATECFLG